MFRENLSASSSRIKQAAKKTIFLCSVPPWRWSKKPELPHVCLSLYLIIVQLLAHIYIYIYKTRLASNEIFSPSNKTDREVGRAKDLSALLYIWWLALLHGTWIVLSKGISQLYRGGSLKWRARTHTHRHTHTHTYIYILAGLWLRVSAVLWPFSSLFQTSLRWISSK